jgi:phage gpG-like protein
VSSLKGKIEARAKGFQRIWDATTATQTSYLGIDVSLKDIDLGGIPDQWQKDVIARMEKNLQESTGTVKDMLDQAMTSAVWEWTDGTRDIVDTGALKSSLTIRMNGFGLVVSYSMPYAAIVHYGGVTRNGFIYPARPWAESVLLGGGPISQINWANVLEGK